MLQLIIIIHFIVDFFFQKRSNALNKHHSILALLEHGVTYTILTLIFTIIAAYIFLDISTISLPILVIYFLYNGAIHTIIDYFTSKINHILYDPKNLGPFIKGLGIDQCLHIITLITSYIIVFSNI